MRNNRILFPLAALVCTLFVFGSRGHAADGNFPIYFSNTKLVVKAQSINRVTYLPLSDIVSVMGLPYTVALALDTLTVRSGNARLVASRNSALISVNDQIILLPSPILREDGKWLGPIDYLTQGLSKLSGTEFRYRSGSSRIFAGSTEAPELLMNAQSLGPITRLTVRSSAPMNAEIRRDGNRGVIALDRTPLDVLQERLEHKDRLVRSIVFDDSDATSKIVMDLTNEVKDIKLATADNNRVLFVDLMREVAGKPVTSLPATAPATAAKPDATTATGERRVRVIVIDPGHGGMDDGAVGSGVNEKDLTLVLARKLRAALQSKLGATVLLTRDSDIAMDNEARSAAANNNQANLFISLHAGYSPNKMDAGSSVFIMKEDFGDALSTTSVSRDQLFLPWYL